MIIRPIEPGDVNTAVRIIADHDSFDGECAAEYFASYLGRGVGHSDSHERNFVAIDGEGGDVVGVCGVCPDKYHTPGILWLTWFYVAREARRKGIGAAMLKHVQAVSAAAGARRLYLDTSSDPKYDDAVRLYERFGFRVEGRLADYYGGGEAMIIMGRTVA